MAREWQPPHNQPQRAAALAARIAAPGYVAEPATTKTDPRLYLLTLAGRSGIYSTRSADSTISAACSTSPITSSSRSYSSPQEISPANLGPSPLYKPILGARSVTVAVASTQTESTAPVSALRPEGTSMETTVRPSSLSAGIQMENGARTDPENPVPNIASSTTSALESTAVSSSREGPTTTCTSRPAVLRAT